MWVWVWVWVWVCSGGVDVGVVWVGAGQTDEARLRAVLLRTHAVMHECHCRHHAYSPVWYVHAEMHE